MRARRSRSSREGARGGRHFAWLLSPKEGTYPEWPQRHNTCVSILSHCYLCSGKSEDTLSCRATIASETLFLAKLGSSTHSRNSFLVTRYIMHALYIHLCILSMHLSPCDLVSGCSHSAAWNYEIVICAACRPIFGDARMCAHTHNLNIKSWLAVHRFRALHSCPSSRSSSTAEWPLCGPLAGTLPRAAPRSLGALPMFRLACTCEHSSSGYSRPSIKGELSLGVLPCAPSACCVSSLPWPFCEAPLSLDNFPLPLPLPFLFFFAWPWPSVLL